MIVKNQICGETYRFLINYMVETCDMILLTKYHNQHPNKTKKTQTLILSATNQTKDDVINNYSDNYLENLYNQLKDNEFIFNKEYQKRFEKYDSNLDQELNQKYKIEGRRHTLWNNINWIIYEHVANTLINHYKKNIKQEKDRFISTPLEKNLYYSTTYYLTITDELKKELLAKHSLYDWCFPNSLENLSFFKNGLCRLDSVAHEELCEIYCESEEEYEFLKSIGIEFVDDHFVETSKERLYYESYVGG